MTENAKTDMNFLPTVEVSEIKVFPHLSVVQFEIISIEDTMSKTSGKRMFLVKYKSVQPEPHTGIWHQDYFVVGGDVDPNDAQKAQIIDPNSKGYQNFSKMRAAADLAKINALDELEKVIKTAHPQLIITLAKDVQEGGDFAGRESNKSINFAKVGAKKLNVPAGDKPKGVAASGGAAKGITIKCKDCGEDIPAAEFGKHLKECPARQAVED